MIPKKPAEIFSYICHFIFAIIIANSYDTATKIFINPEKIFLSDFSLIIPALELLLAYVIIISGWVGYSRSMIKWQHTNTKSGALRFSLDLAILFCYFGLISSADPQNIFREYFLNWIIVLFSLFIVWDILKIKEYYKKANNNKFNVALLRSFWKTVVFFIIFVVVVPFTFNFLLEIQVGIINDDIIYGFILLFVMFWILLYRYWKWSIPPQKRHMQNNTNSKKKPNKSSD